MKRRSSRSVEPVLIMEALDAIDSLAPEDRSKDALSNVLWRLVEARGQEGAELAQALEHRVLAMMRMVSRIPGLPRGGDGSFLITERFIRAAADEPLIEDEDGEVRFSDRSFRARLSSGDAPEGLS